MIDAGKIAPRVVGPVRPRARFGWIYGPGWDLLIALCWVPFFLAAHVLTVRHGVENDHILSNLFNAAFLLSLLHQPLTLALVYGDKNQFALRRKVFTWGPLGVIALISTALYLNLWIVIPIAATWNTIHTLQQRYGLSRIYSRKAGFGSIFLDRWTLYAWLVAAILVAGSTASTLAQLARVMLDSPNAAPVRDLASVRPYAVWLLVPAAVIAVVLLAGLVRQEAEHVEEANRAKWIYQGSSLVLIAAIAFDPLAGFIAYIASHAIEYFIVVYKTMESRYGRTPDRSTFLGRVARTTTGRVAFFAAFGLVVWAMDTKFNQWLPGRSYYITLYTAGMLHFWYDSFIWKLRKPAVAANFGIQTAPVG